MAYLHHDLCVAVEVDAFHLITVTILGFAGFAVGYSQRLCTTRRHERTLALLISLSSRQVVYAHESISPPSALRNSDGVESSHRVGYTSTSVKELQQSGIISLQNHNTSFSLPSSASQGHTHRPRAKRGGRRSVSHSKLSLRRVRGLAGER